VLKMQINKSDRNDAIRIARIMQTGWFKKVHVKDVDSYSVRALLVSRALLVKIKRDLENHVRGLDAGSSRWRYRSFLAACAAPSCSHELVIRRRSDRHPIAVKLAVLIVAAPIGNARPALNAKMP
jgi:transposase